ncbi:stress-responsive transcription factor HSF1 [Kluyveromyces lactis]|uniref:Heat shock transcription factor n=1 Tax=Kluyveromyces lactis (strain ATCC 8585 / CBS 2359 / DSM 70799 / NBRC 1267 / NRRL Y-1140 / WM37) TaxID=284590 RepID=HSF_KLULA|nr:uncharacterized protein KLLA0_D03322g [Kluyveromyces lactis]P22121.1 RecName: Full=Heat shock transcription factor; Short=HSTF; AltName: Full=Heat shock factor protein; Short=HSF [Kluyveromyces lactis NRRL Y-1140]CAA38950.1 Heat shock transcription factor [Kluyveromyces lactis]CAH00310.1 KLLA0D03322p [Kluyveromyces lactis]|eukprot:XP_453214.1 uncharacterized protein KLLA0_D03322g [Kluyveromyces lactis]
MGHNDSVETMDEISNPNNILLPHDGTGLDATGISGSQEPYGMVDVLNPDSLKDDSNVDEPLIEDIVNPSLDPEGVVSAEPSNEVGTPLLQQPISLDHVITRPASAGGVYSIGNSSTSSAAKLSDGDLTNATDPLLNNAHGHGQPSSESQSHSNGYHKQGQSQQPLLSLNKRKLLAKAHVDKHHSKKKLSTTRARPAFVNKLWSMVNDKSNEKFIHWSTSGESIVVPNRERFVQEVLPKYFKHSNFASFVRQLNMYGWHKVQDVKSGSMLSNNDSRWEFENENFKRGKEYLLENIVRQKSNTNILGGTTNAEVDIHILLNELETVKYNQLAIAEDLKRITKDNEMLWKENMMARERHQSQQQVLEKLLRFLSSVFGPNSAKTIGNGFQPDLIHELSDMQVNHMSNNNHNNTGNINPNAYHNETDDPMANVFGPLTPTDQGKVPLQDYKLRPRLLLKNRSMSSSSSSNLNQRQSPQNRIVGQSPPPQQQQQQQQQQGQPQGQQFSYPIQGGNQMMNQLGSPIGTQVGSPVGSQYGNQYGNQYSNQFGNQLQQQTSRPALHHGSNGEIRELTPSIVSSDSPDPAFFQDLQNNIDKQEESIQEIQDWITKLNPGPGEDGNTPIFPELNMPSYFANTGGSGQSEQPSDYGDSQIEELRNSRLHEPDRSFEEKNNGQKRRRAA